LCIYLALRFARGGFPEDRAPCNVGETPSRLGDGGVSWSGAPGDPAALDAFIVVGTPKPTMGGAAAATAVPLPPANTKL
jgi:hypothetical protein